MAARPGNRHAEAAGPASPLATASDQVERTALLVGPAEWDGIAGLGAFPIDAASVIGGFQILQLAAIGTEEVHSLSMRSQDHHAGEIRRVSVWVCAELNANLRLIVRDSVNPRTGRPTNESEIKVDLHTRKIIQSQGDLLRSGTKQGPDGWQVVWVDFRPADGNIFIAIFLLECGGNSHVFIPLAQRLFFGGFDIPVSMASMAIV